jgi:hypothetical protein
VGVCDDGVEAGGGGWEGGKRKVVAIEEYGCAAACSGALHAGVQCGKGVKHGLCAISAVAALERGTQKGLL